MDDDDRQEIIAFIWLANPEDWADVAIEAAQWVPYVPEGE